MAQPMFSEKTPFVPTPPRCFYVLGIVALGLLWTMSLGCGSEEPEIRSYMVPRPKANTASPSSPATLEPRRMLGAILPAGNEAWFLKAVGKPANVEALIPAFEKLLASFAVSDTGEPKWELPENWKQQPGSGMRFATLIAASGDEEIPISVIKLPIFEGTWEEYCESNVNRWRGELSLPNEKWDDIVKYARPLEGQDKTNLEKPRLGYWINIEGKQDPSKSMAGPMAAAGMAGSGATGGLASGSPASGPFSGAPANTDTPAANSSPLKYEVPNGWVDRGASGMRLLTLVIGETPTPPTSANEVTVIPASGDLPSNVRRWQEQLSPAVDESVVNSAIEKAIITKVDGVETKIVHLTDKPEQPQQAILAAIIPMDEQSSLFIKYKGDAQTAEAEKQNFIKFVESVRWK